MRESNNSGIAVVSSSKTRRGIMKVTAGVAAVAAAAGIAASAVPSAADNESGTPALASAYEYYSKVIYHEALKESAAIAEGYKLACENAAKPDLQPESIPDASVVGKAYIQFGKALAEQAGVKPGTKLGAVYDVNTKDEESSVYVSAYANRDPLADLHLVTDSNSVYVSVPTISDGWLTATADEILDLVTSASSMTGVDISADSSVTGYNPADMSFMDGTVLTRERTDRIAQKYSDLYLKYCKNVTILKDQEFEVGSLKTNVAVSKVELSDTELYSLAAETVSTLAKDSDLKAIWKSLGLSSEDYNNMCKDAMESVKELKSSIAGTNTSIFTYIDDSGNIVGNDVYVMKGDDIVSLAGYWMLTEGNSVAVDGIFGDSKSGCHFAFDGGIDENGAFNGVGGVQFASDTQQDSDEDNVDFKLTFSVDNFTENSGKILASVDANDMNCKARIVNNGQKAYGQVVASQNGEKLFSFYIDAAEKEPYDVTVPSQNLYKISNEDDLIKYLTTADFGKLSGNIDAARGSLGNETADSLISTIDSLTQLFAMLG